MATSAREPCTTALRVRSGAGVFSISYLH
jgi:hypothetical protein